MHHHYKQGLQRLWRKANFKIVAEGVDSSSFEKLKKTKPLLRSSLRSCLPGKSVCRFATSPILLGNFLPQLQFRGFPASLVFTTNPLFPPLQLIAGFVSLFLTFVSILSLCCHVTITPTPQFPEKIWATNQREIWAQINGVRPTGSDRLTSGARTAISETTNTGLSAGVSLPAK